MKNLLFLIVLVVPSTIYGSGLQTSFGGSRFPEPRGSMIFQYTGEITSSGNLLDHVENLVTYSDQFDQWLQTNLSVIPDQYANPIDGTKNADVLHEDSANNAKSMRCVDMIITAGRRYTISIYTRPINRQRIGFAFEGGIKRATVDIVTGSIVAINGDDVEVGYKKINNDWARIWMTSTATNNGRVYISPYSTETYLGLDQDAIVVYGADVIDVTDGYIQNPGVLVNTGSVNKPRHDLAPSGSPTSVRTPYQDVYGNPVLGRILNGTTDYYSIAHHNSMNIFDSDHTLTLVFMRDSDATLGNWAFTHGNSTSGIFCGYYAADTYIDCYYGKASGYVYARSNGIPDEGVYHIAQVVRRNNRATMIVDGIPGNSVDVTDYGIDVSTSMILGAYNAGASSLKGSIIYASLDNRALSPAELASDREKIFGVISRKAPSANTNWTFSRSTKAWQPYSTGGIRLLAPNIPRIGDNGGVIIEPTRTNLRTRSENFTQNPPWSPVRASITNTSVTTAPDGTTTTNKVLHEDNTPAASHALSASSYTSTDGNYYTVSIYAKSLNRSWIALYNQASPNGGVYFNLDKCTVGTASSGFTGMAESVGNGWCRVQETHRAASTSQQSTIYIAPSDGSISFDGLNQDSLFIFGAQVEEGKFATTYCGHSESSTLTCYGDDLTINPRAVEGAFLITGDSISRDIAPYLISATGINNTVKTGIGGNTLENVRNRWDSDITPWNPAVVFLHCGVNDILNFGKTLAEMQGDIEWIASRAESEGVKLIVDNTGTANTYTDPMVAQVNAWNSWLATTFVSSHPSVTVLDFMSWAQNGSGDPRVCNAAWFDGTCVHPNTTGYPLWSAIVTATVSGLNLKQSIILPQYFNSSSPYNKLTVELEAKCMFTGSSNAYTNRQLITISGNLGTAHATRNGLDINVSNSGRIYSYLYDDAGVAHYSMTNADPLLFNRWFKVKVFYDFSDMTQNSMYWGYAEDQLTSTGVTYVGNSGTATWDTTNNLIRIGQTHNGTVTSACAIRNLRIDPVER